MWWAIVLGCSPQDVEEPAGSSAWGALRAPEATYGVGEVRLRRVEPPSSAPRVDVGLSLRGPPAVGPVRSGGRTEYLHAGVTEWWAPAPGGLEHGFDVAEPPRGELVLDLVVDGAVAEVDADGLGATLQSPTGGGLRYERLAAWDQRHARLPARMEATESGLRLVVDASDAVGGVTVDPLVPGYAWAVEGDQATAAFGSSVASAGDVNGDGYDDVVIGASGWTGGDTDEGSAFVYLGSAAGLSVAPAWSVQSDQADAKLGASVASAGDVNGDGYDDVVVGAPFYDLRGEPAAGEAYVYLGSAAGLSATADWTAPSSAGGAALGRSVASAGDVNGDGYDDVLVGAPNQSNLGLDDHEGSAYLYLGSAAGLGTSAAWRVDWTVRAAHFGGSVASAGDVNGDGYDDVVVAAEGEGDAYLYLGSASGLSTTPAWNTSTDEWETSVASAGDVNGDGFDDVVVRHSLADLGYLYLGSAAGLSTAPAWTVDEAELWLDSVASAGDVNGDGYDDVLFGSALYLGSALGLSVVPSLTGDDAWSASAGDVNGDGLDDVVLGDPNYSNPQQREGVAVVSLGVALADTDGDTLPDVVDLCPASFDDAILDTDGDGVGNGCDDPTLTFVAPLTPGGPLSLTATGASPGESVSFSAALGSGSVGPCPAPLGGLCLDLGPSAALLGTASADASGEAHLTTTVPAGMQPNGPYAMQASIARGAGGSASVKSPLVIADGTALDWDSDGLTDAAEGVLGSNPRIPDTDGDGLVDGDDVPPWFDPTDRDSDGDGVLDGVDACGAGDDLADVDLDAVADACDVCPAVYDPGQEDSDGNGRGDACPWLVGPAWSVEADAPNPVSAVASAGDVNGDGYDDVLVGMANTTQPGTAYLFFGSTRGLSDAPDWIERADQYGAELGASLASAGDVNGDGYDDVVIGARGYAQGQADEGVANLYLGSATGLTISSWTGQVNQAAARFGASVASAGDVNGDGYDDVVVGASGYDHGETDEGAAFLYLGSAGGLAAVPAWATESNLADAALGASVASAGDVNDDGYDDVIVGSSGKARAYLGSAGGLALQPAWVVSVGTNGGVVVSSAGDVNDDGSDDVVVANPTLGVVDLYLGSTAGLSPTPATTFAPGIPLFGSSVATVGDVNRDGFADVAIGSPSEDNGGGFRGTVYLHLGSPTGLSTEPAWIERSAQSNENFGSSVAGAGDVYGDGYDHLLVGSRGTDVPDVGAVYAWASLFVGNADADTDGDGRTTLSDVCPEVADPAQLDTDGDGLGNACDEPMLALDGFVSPGGQASLVATGAAPGEKVWFAGAAGSGSRGPCGPQGQCLDLGPNPVLLGWAIADATGEARFGVPVPGGALPVGPYVAQAVILRWASSVWSPPVLVDGSSLDWDADGLSNAGELSFLTDPLDPDTDGDGLLDGLDLPPAFDPLDPDTDGDGVLDGADVCPNGSDTADGDGDGVLDGCDVCPTVYDPGQADTDADGRGDACPVVGNLAWSAESDAVNARLGESVASAGDVNGDGFDDVIAGARFYPDGGAAFVYLGSIAGPGVAPAWTADPNQASAVFGASVASAGDVNGDGFDDVIVGASRYVHTQSDEGAAFVYLGSAAGLSPLPAWAAVSGQAGALFGSSVASAGDVNGDGFDDVIVGAPEYTNGTLREGAAFLYLGSAAGPRPAPAWSAESNRQSASFGGSVASAGDVDGDGFDDVIVGARAWDQLHDTGAVFLYRGSVAGLSAAPSWSAIGSQAFASFGNAVASAGDVNGDGFGDVVVADEDQGDGAAFVYLGSATGLGASPAWSAMASETDEMYGHAVGSGDVNGDGYDDVIVGAVGHGPTLAGAVYVYLGSPSGASASPSWLGASDRDGARAGSAVASGDVNGDGFDDLVVGAPEWGGGQNNEGAVLFYPSTGNP